MSDSAPRSGIGGLFALGVKRPVGMGMIVAAAVVFGFISLQKLPVDLLPPVNYPSLTVRTTYNGAAPEDVEERVTERLEDILSTVGHLVNISSSSRAEVSEIFMELSGVRTCHSWCKMCANAWTGCFCPMVSISRSFCATTQAWIL